MFSDLRLSLKLKLKREENKISRYCNLKRQQNDNLKQLGISRFLLSSMQVEESIGSVQMFNFRFLMDVLGCPEHDLTIFGKCLSVCLSVSVCLRDKNFVANLVR